jgi:hypothetical protein
MALLGLALLGLALLGCGTGGELLEIQRVGRKV